MSDQGYTQFPSTKSVLERLKARDLESLKHDVLNEPGFANHLAWLYIEECWNEIAERNWLIEKSEISALVLPICSSFEGFYKSVNMARPIRFAAETIRVMGGWVNPTTGEVSGVQMRNQMRSRILPLTNEQLAIVTWGDDEKETVCLDMRGKIRETDTGKSQEVTYVPVSWLFGLLAKKQNEGFRRLIDEMGGVADAILEINDRLLANGRKGLACCAEEAVELPRAPIIQTESTKYTIGLFG